MDFLEPKDHCTKMMMEMYSLSQDQSLCDLSIFAANDDVFKVHKCVFAAASPTLKEMIIKENRRQKRNFLRISPKDLTSEGIKHFIDYVYTGKAPKIENIDDNKEFENACTFFGIEIKNTSEVIVTSKFDDSPKNLSNDSEDENVSNNECSVENLNENQVSEAQNPKIDITIEQDPIDEPENDDETFPNNLTVVDDRPNSPLIVQILHPDDDSYVSDSDTSFQPVLDEVSDFSDTDIDDDLPIISRNRGKENKNKSGQPPSKRRALGKSVSRSSTYVDGLDISSLFSVKKKSPRNYTDAIPEIKMEFDDAYMDSNMEVMELSRPKRNKHSKPKFSQILPLKYNPDNALKRGRPRVAHDDIFPNEPPYICPHQNCDRVYDTREKVKKHYKSHEERKFVCEYCDKKFLYNKDLITHLRIHTGEKPFVCEICSASFTQKSTLKYHMKTHSDNVEQYYCEQCGQQYRSEKGLRNHAKLHTEEGVAQAIEKGKPHSCPICAKRYCNEAGVKQHLKRSHPESEIVKKMPRLPRKKKNLKKELQGLFEIHEDFGQTVIEYTETPEDNDGELQSEYICPRCNIIIGDENEYKTHIADCQGLEEIHYICGECGEQFNTEEEGADHQCMSDKTPEEKLDAVAAAVSSIGGVVTTEGCDVKILNLENMFPE